MALLLYALRTSTVPCVCRLPLASTSRPPFGTQISDIRNKALQFTSGSSNTTEPLLAFKIQRAPVFSKKKPGEAEESNTREASLGEAKITVTLKDDFVTVRKMHA